MEKFAIYGRVVLSEFPDWFPEFYARHGAFFDKHVTLKQACLAEEADTSRVQSLLESFFATRFVADGQINLVFDRVRADPLGDCIMVDSQRSETLNTLQASLLQCLKDHRNYEKSETEKYEKNFDPHITIADNMTPEETMAALRELPKEFVLKGGIEEIVLIVDGILTTFLLKNG